MRTGMRGRSGLDTRCSDVEVCDLKQQEKQEDYCQWASGVFS